MKVTRVWFYAVVVIGLCAVPAVRAAKKHPHHKSGGSAKPATPSPTEPADADAVDAIAHRKHPFVVYEHIHTRGRPDDLTGYGLVPIELCYNTKTKQAVEASVKAKAENSNGAPIVFDIEKTNRNDHDVSSGHLKDVAKWAHEAVPGVKVGHYAVGPSHLTPLGRPIEKSVDAFFPSMYVHNTNRRAWQHTADKLVEQGHRAHKPVYLFLMPKFHGRKGGDIPQAFWAFQLQAAYRSGADGVVIWASNRDQWSENAGWWQATKHFMSDLQAGKMQRSHSNRRSA
ncbi:MAG: hypothetical protein GC162_20505 [Planctomycetes bacterium]|nr:hypothetical protein [Planctomycetota bacterium]